MEFPAKKILWFAWKDLKHPAAGGAELVKEEIAKRLVAKGFEVTLLVAGFPGCVADESIDGYKIIRLGNRFSVYWKAFRYYSQKLAGKFDLIIDEMNTMPFFCKYYAKEKNIMFVHQLCRQTWFYEMFFPMNLFGYLLEPVYLRFLNDREVITISESTKEDLMRYGFRENKIEIISEGIACKPIADLNVVRKFDKPTIIALGGVRPMKRTLDVVRAFEIAKKEIAELGLIVAGNMNGEYGQKVKRYSNESVFADSISMLGAISPEKKIELLQKAHIHCVASVKEGWCLTVTEAGSQGTPSVVYNVDGLRDSVFHGEAGRLCAVNTPQEMARQIVGLLQNNDEYARLRVNAHEKSHSINFDNCAEEFIKAIGN